MNTRELTAEELRIITTHLHQHGAVRVRQHAEGRGIEPVPKRDDLALREDFSDDSMIQEGMRSSRALSTGMLLACVGWLIGVIVWKLMR